MQIGGAGMPDGVAGQRLSFLNCIFLQAWFLIHLFTLINFWCPGTFSCKQAHFGQNQEITQNAV